MKIIAATSTLLAAGILAACQSQPVSTPGGTQQQTAFLADRADPCQPERQILEQSGRPENNPLDGVLDTTLAVGGVIESLRTTGRASGTLSPRGITLAGDYIEALRRENGTVLAILQDVTRDIEAENRRIDGLLAAFSQLRACRRAGASAIREDFQAGSVSREDAAAGMIQLRGALRQDITRARALAEQVSRNTRTYADVYNDIAEDNDAEALELGPYRRKNFDRGTPSAKLVRKRTPRTRVSPAGALRAPERTRGLKPQVEHMQQQILTNVRKRDAIINQVEVALTETDELDLAVLPRSGRQIVPG